MGRVGPVGSCEACEPVGRLRPAETQREDTERRDEDGTEWGPDRRESVSLGQKTQNNCDDMYF